MLSDILIHEYINNRAFFIHALNTADKIELQNMQEIVFNEYCKQPHISIERSILKSIYRVIGEYIYD